MKSTLRVGLVLGLLCAAVPAQAGMIFYLDEVNTTAGLNPAPWASITLTDTTVNGQDGVHFVVDPIESAFQSIGSNFGLQTFYFNEGTTFGSSLEITNFDPADWTYNYSAPASFNTGGAFGKFEFLAKGTGSTRANPLEFDVIAPLGFSLTIEELSSVFSNGNELFAAHIADYSGGKSAKFATNGPGTPVPEPGSLLLLGSGLFAAGLVRRRMKKA